MSASGDTSTSVLGTGTPIKPKTLILGVNVWDENRAKVTGIAHDYRVPLLKAFIGTEHIPDEI